MSQNIMWIQFDSEYRGQSTAGIVVTVAEDAMNIALRRAGKDVFDTDWWVETLTRVLEHWGIFSKRWVDPVTYVTRMHFITGTPKAQPPGTGPLTTRIQSGSLERNK